MLKRTITVATNIAKQALNQSTFRTLSTQIKDSSLKAKFPVNGSHSTILGAFKYQDAYISPYAVQAPLDYIIIHNRSKNAANFAVRKLKDAWPTIKIIHVVQEDRDPIPGYDIVVRIKDWSSMDHFKQQFDAVMARDPVLRKSMTNGNVGFYSVWSAQAENSQWAISAQNAGFKWIGASPDKMKGLDKIEYKKLCQEKGLPTADFVVIEPPVNTTEKDAAFKLMAEQLVERYHATPELAGKPVFVKHNEGGGGRGTKKVAVMNYDNALEAIRKIVNETGGNLNGVYAEQALDLEGAQMFQIEIECDASSMAHGGRLVWFNKENQKVLEVGFTDTAILQMLPKDVYEGCRAASKVIFDASGYDSRGTNEILIIKDKHDKWHFKLLELNKRIQVENEALSELVVDHNGNTRNVPAEQVMRAMGYPAPGQSDFNKKGPAIVAHVRLLSCEITTTGSKYPSGLEIDGALYPQGADVQIASGPVYLDADPQIGRALITGQTWEEFCDKFQKFTQEFQFYGPKTHESTYFEFLRKLAADPIFIAKKLGCNHTFNVLSNSPVNKGRVQNIVAALSSTVTPLVTNGYRPKNGVKHQAYPTIDQIKEFTEHLDELQFEVAPQTPFSKFLTHSNFATYIQDLKDLLANHGGGTVTVIRDVQQSTADQESALIQSACAKIAEIYFAGSGIGVGYETGGAQYQAGLMRKFDWMSVLLSGCLTNLASHSLTRSKWLNGLTIKTPEEQAFVFRTIANEISNLYGVSAKQLPFIHWIPYNFHAGNHPEQDITTREMLRANLAVIPNWAWDPRYSDEHFTGWVTRQINLFEQEGKPLSQIRIKNAGQGPKWNAEVIVKLVQTIRAMFKQRGLEEPIIFIHNHEFNGMAAHIGYEAIKKCQALGYPLLIVDSAPPGTSHNSNLIISKAFHMSPEEREKLKHYNHRTQLALDLTNRFNNQNITKIVQDPDSEMAGGTNSSDIEHAKEAKIPLTHISGAIALGRKITGLGTAVTPISEWIKQIGFAFYLKNLRTVQDAEEYIKNGGQLEIDKAYLEGLQEWPTLLPRPQLIEQLLINHNLSPKLEKSDSALKAPLDIEAMRIDLQAKLPNTKVGDREISTVIAFDNIGLESLMHRDHSELADGPRDMTVMMDSPGFTYSQEKKAGDTFSLYGEKITIRNVQPHKQTGTIEVDYAVRGHTVRTFGIDSSIQANSAVKQVRYVKDKTKECGAPMAGKIIGSFFVKPNDVVKKGDPLGLMEAMKMQIPIKADADGIVDTVKTFDGKNQDVDGREVIITFK